MRLVQSKLTIIIKSSTSHSVASVRTLQAACSITPTKQAINTTYKNNLDLCSYVFFQTQKRVL